MTLVQTVCGMCGADVCGIEVTAEGSSVTELRGLRDYPVNLGRTCPQAHAGIELANDLQRLKEPLRRVGDRWQPISWNDALDEIAGRFVRLAEEDGPQALAVYQGRALLQFMAAGWPQRFLNAYGTANLVRNDHMCSFPTVVAEKITYGSTTVYGFDADEVQCIVLWGADPSVSHIPVLWRDVQAARKRGCRVIVVDPRRTRSAELADIHLSLRPGTDAALALAFLHVIITESLFDASFVSNWTVGFDALSQRVRDYTPRWAEEVSGVPADLIRSAARMYGTTHPAYLDTGNAIEHHSNSGQTLRSVLILRAITGNLDVAGGHVLSPRSPIADVSLRSRAPRVPPVGAERYPLFVKHAHCVPGDAFVDSVLEGKPYRIRQMLLAGGNPMLTWPNTKRVEAALRRLDFLVVLDIYMTETARLANIVLPVASVFERDQFLMRPGAYGTRRSNLVVMLRKKVLDPGERRSDWWILAELARRMGLAEFYPWSSEEDAIDAQLAPMGISTADLRQRPGGLLWGSPQIYRKYETEGFSTPSGKVEVSSSEMAEAGYDPLPTWCEPMESPISSPEVAERFPLVLSAGRRSPYYTLSRHRNLPSLRRAEPDPYAVIHPATAERYGISDGDLIDVQSVRGSIQLRAFLTPTLREEVVSLLPGWVEANANILTDDAQCDPLLACPPIRAGLCSIRPSTDISQE